MGPFNNFNDSTYKNSFMQSIINSNVIFVTSLDEALYKTNSRNSDMVYFHQDQNIFYRVKVDSEGRKTWAQFNYILPDENTQIPATRADLNELKVRLDELEKFMSKKEATNGEPDGNN